MSNCPKCGLAVNEEKAFCQNCGASMTSSTAKHEPAIRDFGATIIESHPKHTAQPYRPPAIPEVPPVRKEAAPVSQPKAQPPAPPPAARKSSMKFGVIFILLLLFLIFVAFVLAIWLD